MDGNDWNAEARDSANLIQCGRLLLMLFPGDCKRGFLATPGGLYPAGQAQRLAK